MGFEHKAFSQHKTAADSVIRQKKNETLFFLFIHLGIFVISEVQNISF